MAKTMMEIEAGETRLDTPSVTYRLSHGNNGSAFQQVGTRFLDDFPDDLRLLATFLRENTDVVDLCATRADGGNLVVRREEEAA